MSEYYSEIELDIDDEIDEDISIKEYDIISSPNDFNLFSYVSFIDSGAIKIPVFQRHYVWDIRRASKLIESLIIGLPIPQIFLYEGGKNKFSVIDGQQRLMTIYYFVKGRFPKRDARAKIRQIFSEKNMLEPVDFENDELFIPFRLSFSDENQKNRYSGLSYLSLGEMKSTFDLRTLRNIVVKQVRPEDDHSSIFELFNRLNTGGINLGPQEIRMSIFHGPFLKKLAEINENTNWRKVVGSNPDQRQRDVEVLLRMVALAYSSDTFTKPLSKFINKFISDQNKYCCDLDVLEKIFDDFFKKTAKVTRELLLDGAGRLSVTMLEAIFCASANEAIKLNNFEIVRNITDENLRNIRSDKDFISTFTGKTTDVPSVKGRIEIACKFIK